MPQPDDPGYEFDDRSIRIMQGLARVLSNGNGEGNTSHHGNDNGGNNLTNWLLTIMGVLMSAGIIGGVALYAKVESIDNTMGLLLSGKIVIVRPQDGR